MTSREEIKIWFTRPIMLSNGKKRQNNLTHMLVVCDTFDYTDYPVYVSANQNVREVYSNYDSKNMQRVMEVYSYKLPIEKQLKEERSFHFE